MNIKHFVSALAIAACGSIAAMGAANATSDANELSPANRALFTTHHLASIKEPAVLIYDFAKKGSLESGFTDTVEAEVTNVEADGHKDMSFRFLTGEHHLEFRDFVNQVGNPIFMLFLERDVREMQRLTRGNALYYRVRIRNALAGSASVKPTTFDFNGKTLTGTEIRVQPFANDPLNEKYPRFAKKSYVFILSNEIPGGFYKMDASTPDPSGDQPLVDESVTFREMRAPETAHAGADTPRQAVADKAK